MRYWRIMHLCYLNINAWATCCLNVLLQVPIQTFCNSATGRERFIIKWWQSISDNKVCNITTEVGSTKKGEEACKITLRMEDPSEKKSLRAIWQYPESCLFEWREETRGRIQEDYSAEFCRLTWKSLNFLNHYSLREFIERPHNLSYDYKT